MFCKLNRCNRPWLHNWSFDAQGLLGGNFCNFISSPNRKWAAQKKDINHVLLILHPFPLPIGSTGLVYLHACGLIWWMVSVGKLPHMDPMGSGKIANFWLIFLNGWVQAHATSKNLHQECPNPLDEPYEVWEKNTSEWRRFIWIKTLGIAYRFFPMFPKIVWVMVSDICLCSPLFGEDFQFDEHIFQRGWCNHQLVVFLSPTFPWWKSLPSHRQLDQVYFADLAGRENERSTQVPGGEGYQAFQD